MYTVRQNILDIMDDASNRDELILRLIDFVEAEQDRHFNMGERANQLALNSPEAVVLRYSQNKAAATLA